MSGRQRPSLRAGAPPAQTREGQHRDSCGERGGGAWSLLRHLGHRNAAAARLAGRRRGHAGSRAVRRGAPYDAEAMAAGDRPTDLRDAVGGAARAPARRRPTARRRRSSARPRPSSATTAPTRRCCSPRRWARSPRDVAERLRDELEPSGSARPSSGSRSPGPGFVNLFLADGWYRRGDRGACSAPARARPPAPTAAPERVLVEFVSANPTGPLHRRAAAATPPTATPWRGCCEAVGHEVEREYYVNDAGGQIERFADSIAARMTRRGAARGRLRGRVRRRARRAARRRGGRPGRPRRRSRARGVELMLERDPRRRCERFGVDFDSWFSERNLYEPRRGRGGARPSCERRGHAYEQRGRALAADHRVRRRQGPGPGPRRRRADLLRRRRRLPPRTSCERGFERLIDVLGADHHGYVARMRAAIEALGADPRRLRGADHAAGQHRRGRRAGADVEAQRRVRHPRRAARRHRRRRDPLVHAPAQPRHDRRPRPRAGAAPVEREPRLLRPVRARPDRQHPAQGRRGGEQAPRRGAPTSAPSRAPLEPSRARAGQAAARASRRGARGGASGGRRTGSAPTRRRSPPTSTPSTATARWSAPRARGSSRRGSPSAW